jgi:hypothetical protein
MGELWAWPSALKLALVDTSVRIHRRGARRQPRRSGNCGIGSVTRFAVTVDRGCRMASRAHPALHHPVTAAIAGIRERDGITPRSRKNALAGERRLDRRGDSPQRGDHQASEQRLMASLVGSLRLVSTFDWSEFFEKRQSRRTGAPSRSRGASTDEWISGAAIATATRSRNWPNPPGEAHCAWR